MNFSYSFIIYDYDRRKYTADHCYVMKSVVAEGVSNWEINRLLSSLIKNTLVTMQEICKI